MSSSSEAIRVQLMTPGLDYRFVLLAATLVASACADSAPSSSGGTGSTQPSTPLEWTQIWNDEFDGPAGSAVDATKWANDVGDGCAQRLCGYGNNELEYYSTDPSNI